METKVKCKEEYMTMMVRKEAFEMLKVPLVSIHLKNRNCKVLEMYEDGVVFLGAKLTSENHTTCGSQIKVRFGCGLAQTQYAYGEGLELNMQRES